MRIQTAALELWSIGSEDTHTAVTILFQNLRQRLKKLDSHNLSGNAETTTKNALLLAGF